MQDFRKAHLGVSQNPLRKFRETRCTLWDIKYPIRVCSLNLRLAKNNKSTSKFGVDLLYKKHIYIIIVFLKNLEEVYFFDTKQVTNVSFVDFNVDIKNSCNTWIIELLAFCKKMNGDRYEKKWRNGRCLANNSSFILNEDMGNQLVSKIKKSRN